MRIDNNFAVSNSSNVQQKKAHPSFGIMTAVAKDYIKTSELFQKFNDPKALNALRNDPFVVLDFLPTMKYFQLNWTNVKYLPENKLFNIYSKKGFKIPEFTELPQTLIDLYHSMTIATRQKILTRLENSKIKTKTIKNEIDLIKKYLISFETSHSEEALKSKKEVYQFAIDDFREVTLPKVKRK